MFDDDDLMNRPRIYRRDWRRAKPHLSKSTSLPALYPIPSNRPIFTCERCGFSNIYIPLCLWCTWSSRAATQAFHDALPRIRRMSGPARVIWSAGDNGSEISTHPSAADLLDANSATNARSSVAQSMPQAHGQIEESRVTSHEGEWSADSHDADVAMVHPPSRNLVEAVGLNRKLFQDLEQHAHIPNCSWLPVLAPEVIKTAQYSRTRRGLPPLHAPTTPHDCYHDTNNHDPPAHDMPDTYAQDQLRPNGGSRHSRRPTAVDISAGPPHTPHRRASRPPSSLSTSTVDGATPRSLRRTKRHSQMRKKSSRSLRSRASSLSPPSPHALETPPRKGKQPVSMALSSTSAPEIVSNVRLGHPSRPYYTAIRKNMSRPSTPFGPYTTNQTPAQSPPSPVRSTFSQARPSPDYAPSAVAIPQRMSVPARRGGGSGWSVSGEMEMHIALAARRSADASHARQEYVFCDAPELRTDKVSRVRRWGQGLKKFVLGRN